MQPIAAMGKKKSKKRAKKKKRTMLPPSGAAGAGTQRLSALAAEAAANDPILTAAQSLDTATVSGVPDTPSEVRETRVVPKEEHRATPRTRTSLEVELHLASDSHFFSGLSGDISEGGIFVSTYRDLATGTHVDLEFSLPGTDRIVKAKGEVKWHRSSSPGAPPGVGIAFEELDDADRALIHRFCTMRPPLYYEDVG